MEQNFMQVDLLQLDADKTENKNAVFPTDICETFLEACSQDYFAGAFVKVNCSEASQKNGEKTSKPNVATFCRVCAMSKPHVLSIYGDYGREFRLARKINKYLPIVVSESDKLPLVLCRECVTNFAAFDKMFENSLRAEKKLMSMLETENNVMKVKDETEVKDEWNQRIKSSSEGEERIDHIFGDKTSEPVDSVEALPNLAPPNLPESSSKPVKSKRDVSLFVECSYCKCLFVKECFLEHAVLCKGIEDIPVISSNVRSVKRKKVADKGINTKGLREVLGLNKPLAKTKAKKAVTPKKRGITIFGKYSIVGGIYVCGLCSIECPDASSFVSHRNKDCPFDHFPCSNCDASFRKNVHLRSHISRVHLRTKEYICDICGKSVFNRAYLIEHIKYHLRERAFKCDECPLDFKRIDHLQQHQRNKHDKPILMAGLTSFICEICSGRFRNESKLRIHQRMHTGALPYVCEKCGRGFLSEAILRNHRSRVNCTDPLYLRGAKQKEKAKTRMQYKDKAKNKEIVKGKQAYRSRKDVPPRFKCDQCPRAFHWSSLLKVHIRGIHLKEKPFACKFCDKKFHDNTTLCRHRAKEHTGLNYSCEICLRRFFHPSAVKAHMTSHQTDKTHQCPECGKLFKYLGDLNRHIKKDHHEGKLKLTNEKEREREGT